MKCLRNRGYLSRPIDIEFFDHNDLPAIYRTLAEKNAEANQNNRQRNNEKARHMRYAHNLIVSASAIFFVTIAVYGGVLLEKSFTGQQKKGWVTQMGDDNSNNQTSNQQSTTVQQPNIPKPTTQPKPYEVLERGMPDDSVPLQKKKE
jgi:cytoskeletal protein RodZ